MPKTRQARIKIECEVCHESFMAKPSEIEVGRKFCSRACWRVFNARTIETCICLVCGEAFRIKPGEKQTAKYCSRTCKGLARRNKTEFPCLLCGKPFVTWPSAYGKGHSYCSTECSRKALSIGRQGNKNPAWRGGCKLDRGRNWSAQRKLTLKRDGNICQYCGKINKAKRKFQVHHIKPYRTFNGDYIQANQLSNLIVLCGPCHGKAETGKIAIQPKLL